MEAGLKASTDQLDTVPLVADEGLTLQPDSFVAFRATFRADRREERGREVERKDSSSRKTGKWGYLGHAEYIQRLLSRQ